MATDILFPPGRMIGGNIDKLFPRNDNLGNPKLSKDGQPEMQCSIGLAIPKGAEQSWTQTPWGAIIYAEGSAAHPNYVASPAFSWKITDGDSPIPNKRGNKPCDQIGYPGHWVIWFSQGWLPKRVNSTGAVELSEGSIIPGYYIQVFGSVAGNKLVPNGTPGVYLNPIAVALVGEGDKIATDVDTTTVGFGQAPPPAGARPVTPAAPAFAPPPGVPTPTPPAPVAPVVAPVVPLAPNPAFLAPPPVPAAPVHTMTALAQAPYEAYIAQGWTDDMLRQNGLMV